MSSFDRLVDMIEQKNDLVIPLTRKNISFDNVLSDVSTDWNTRATVRALPEGEYASYVQVYYTRVHLTVLGVPIELMQEAPYTLESMLAQINATRSSQLTAEDLTLTEIPAMETGVVKTFTVSANTESLAWLGNTRISLLTGIPAEARNLATFVNKTLPKLFA